MSEPPRLCSDHIEVIRGLKKKDHVGDEDSYRVAASIATGCPQCYALNDRRLV